MMVQETGHAYSGVYCFFVPGRETSHCYQLIQQHRLHGTQSYFLLLSSDVGVGVLVGLTQSEAEAG
jgi:hypothetical protein